MSIEWQTSLQAAHQHIAKLEAQHTIGFCGRYQNGDSCRESDDCITEWCFGCLLENRKELVHQIKELKAENARLRAVVDVVRENYNQARLLHVDCLSEISKNGYFCVPHEECIAAIETALAALDAKESGGE